MKTHLKPWTWTSGHRWLASMAAEGRSVVTSVSGTRSSESLVDCIEESTWIAEGRPCPFRTKPVWLDTSSAVKNVTSKRCAPILFSFALFQYFITHSLTHLPRQFQLRDMKCNIDNKCPREASHLKIKAKTKTIMEERFAQIESENRLLLEKMSHILRVSFTSSRLLRPRSWNLTRTQMRILRSSSKVGSIALTTVLHILTLWVKNAERGSCNVSPKKIRKS